MTAGSLSTTRSSQLYRRALELLPGGVSSPVRAMRAIGRDPLFIERGEGAELVDVDGNRYVDYVCSWGPLIVGHAHPAVIEAVREAAGRGTSYGAPTEGEVELAAEIVRRVPSAEMARMTSSGTEAAMSAIRLARAATGRDPVLKFSGAYHGHVDGLLAEAGSGLATHAIPSSPGVTRAQAADTEIVPWNDRAAVERALERRPPAAILCEPYPANMGLVPPDEGFLRFLREAADASGALLVFDEVITGFRVARGGAQERAGVTPDLTILGKVVGGGLPAAAFAGRRDLMELTAPAGDVYQAGTLSGNPLAVAAGLATLGLLDQEAYEALGRKTAALAEGLERAIADTGAAACVTHAPGLLTLFFRADPPRDLDEVRQCDLEAHGAFCRAMLERGVYLPPSQYEAWFPSLAHSEEQVERTIEAAREALAAL
ncbi:MAG: glutamate-1-semialdehyde 2,1-aminomutase [Thermoleophilaceae bacterium]|nr:glutamate-1-semialdehyde 2,1-aminomutase [Thermoleophilaceae bacterium]